MEEELLNINRKLTKIIKKSEIDESIVQTLLVRLEDLDVTLTMLQKTGIGKSVNELRRLTSNENLTTMAKNLLKKWKKLLPTSSGKDTEPKHPQLADPVRLKSREMLAKALSIAAIPQGSRAPEELSARIEEAIFNEIKDTKTKYGHRVRSRIFNLRDLKNPDLRTRVLNGTITPEQFAVMTSEEMTSEHSKKEHAKLKELTYRESLLPVDEGVGCNLLKCEKCGANNCSYSELQTLSGDEPMTVFALCRSCGHRWRG
ncbi:unnamed protein product [Adineta ricciae]|uniref:Transcription elongation factor S-II n=1 Tax=Adineta ricciae TaxID=249248 RepID=A0A815WTF1_ADIRI|nr:unnamed protein product [Adineta ricciae]